MERIIKWSGISSVVLFWVFTVFTIADEIIRKNVVIVHALVAILMVMFLVWLDRLAAFKKNLIANTLSLLLWAWITFASFQILREETLKLSDAIIAVLLGTFAIWKMITAILVYLTKSKTEPGGSTNSEAPAST